MKGSSRQTERNIFNLSSTGKESLVGDLTILGDLLDDDKRYAEDFYSKPIKKWDDDDVKLYFSSLGCGLLLQDLIELKRITGYRIVEFEDEIIDTISTKSKDEDKSKFVEEHIKYLGHVIRTNKKRSRQIIGKDFHYIHDIKIYKKRYEFWEEMAPQVLVDFILSMIDPTRMKDFFFRNFLGHVEKKNEEKGGKNEDEDEDNKEEESELTKEKEQEEKRMNKIQVIFCHSNNRKFFGVVLLGDVFVTVSDHGCVIPMRLKDSKRLLDPKKMKKGIVVEERLASSSMDEEFSITKEEKIDRIEFVVNITLKTSEEEEKEKKEEEEEGEGEEDNNNINNSNKESIGEKKEEGKIEKSSVSVSRLVDRLCVIFATMNKERLRDGSKSSKFAVRVCQELGVDSSKIDNLNDKIRRIFKRRGVVENKVL